MAPCACGLHDGRPHTALAVAQVRTAQLLLRLDDRRPPWLAAPVAQAQLDVRRQQAVGGDMDHIRNVTAVTRLQLLLDVGPGGRSVLDADEEEWQDASDVCHAGSTRVA